MSHMNLGGIWCYLNLLWLIWSPKLFKERVRPNLRCFEVEDESSLSEGDLNKLHMTGEKSILVGIGPEPGTESSSFLPESETRAKPGSDPFECQPEPFPVYEE